MGTWNNPDPHVRQWRRTKHRRHRYPRFVRYAAIALAAVLALTLAFRGIRWTMHTHSGPDAVAPASYSSLTGPFSAPGLAAADNHAAWQDDFNVALDSAMQDIADGQIGASEIAIDRAEAILTTERLVAGDAKPDFFAPALSAFDRLLQKRPNDSRLFEHVTLARVSLAEFQSSLTAEPIEPGDAKRVAIGVPRPIAAGESLDPSSFGGHILDATLMPGTSEILVPPSSRAFKDNVRVGDVVMEGAAQTLDGVHWRNVTFVGTRLRYEGGELDLQDVRFVRCRFGFVTDGRGARLATAIAQGQSSIQIP